MRHFAFTLLTLSLLLGSFGLIAADQPAARPNPPVHLSNVPVPPERLAAFHPLPPAMEDRAYPMTAARVALGRMLYYDPRLSASQKVSCNTCHPLDKYGVDNEAVSTGVKGQHGARNAPTVYNSAGHASQFWDGRAATVEEQAKGPMMNPVEMGMDSQARVVVTVGSIWEYRDLFRKAFPGHRHPISFENVAVAIGAFERGLVTPSRWDRFLRGDRTALTDEEIAGFNTFYEVGCATCHNGTYLGGEKYEKLGALKPWPDTHDPGRFEVTRREADRAVFKIAGLRNVAMTAPYYHDGSVATLPEAIRMMGEYQLGRKLDAAQIGSIETYLKALTGQIPSGYVSPPPLPPSRHDTPRPITD
ncbi:MAG TPA: cytochrome c peroxidase [Bryobacteraceae bacterium]|nr:cytochrome c peroxidase [Bryobacteraceae bacterium]